MEQLEYALLMIRARGLKSCLYSGCNSIGLFERWLPLLDYIKLGPYVEEKGGLDNPNTNQRFYRITAGKLTDETWMFQRKKEEHDH